MNKMIRKLIQDLESQGWRVEKGRGGHYKAFAPDGVGLVVFPSTPSDNRSMKNALATLRRHGFKG